MGGLYHRRFVRSRLAQSPAFCFEGTEALPASLVDGAQCLQTLPAVGIRPGDDFFHRPGTPLAKPARIIQLADADAG